MLRILAGILLVQIASVALVLMAGVDVHDWQAWLPIVFALGITIKGVSFDLSC